MRQARDLRHFAGAYGFLGVEAASDGNGAPDVEKMRIKLHREDHASGFQDIKTIRAGAPYRGFPGSILLAIGNSARLLGS